MDAQPQPVGGEGFEKSAAVVREEVRRAIQRHRVGDSDAYDRVKEVFAADPKELEDDGSPLYDLPTHTSLKNHLLGLFSNISSLDGTCSGLVHVVLASEWVGRDEAYVKLFIRFLGTLAAARGGYLNSILKMLVNGLRQGTQSLMLRRVIGLTFYPQSLRVLESFQVIHLFAIPRYMGGRTWR
jgi:RNA polymerase I-specific transcription initiation factor RRN3